MTKKPLDTTTPEETPEEQKEASPLGSVFEISRKLLMAAIGAAVIAEEEITSFVSRMVERGEIAEKDARTLLKEVLESREKVARQKIEEIRRGRPVTVATKSDIEELNAKIAELSKKLEELKPAQ
jgi:polyhydroxyalkanoate synthesis regulator phasin